MTAASIWWALLPAAHQVRQDKRGNFTGTCDRFALNQKVAAGSGYIDDFPHQFRNHR